MTARKSLFFKPMYKPYLS